MPKSEDRSRLQNALNRLEPWAIFLSLLAILFVPWGKGYYWLVLLVMACINFVRRWRETWRWVSSDSMGDLVSAGAWIPTLCLSYALLHAAAPSLVHTLPSFEHVPAVYDLAPVNAEGPTGWQADVATTDRGFMIRVTKPAANGMDQPVFSAELRWNSLARGVVVADESEVPLHHGDLRTVDIDPAQADESIRAAVRVAPDARLTHIVLRSPGGFFLELTLTRRKN